MVCPPLWWWCVHTWYLLLLSVPSFCSLMAKMVNNPPAMWETWVWSLDWEDALEKGMATHSSILAWRIPWTEEPGGLQPMGSQKGHEWATFFRSGGCYFLVSLYLLPRICPKCAGTLLFLVLYNLFLFVARGEVCPGASIATLQQRIPGPSLSHFQYGMSLNSKKWTNKILWVGY